MNNTVSSIVESVKNLTVIDLVDLNEKLKEALGVSDSMLASSAPAAAPAASSSAEVAVEKTAFTVCLKSSGATKINVIKAVRELTGLGLKEAKELVDSCANGTVVVKENLSKEESDVMCAKLKEAGAEVEVK